MSKRLLIETGILTLLFGISFFFPICDFYFSQANGPMVKAPQYLNAMPLVYGLFFVYAMILTALFSGHKMLLVAIDLIALASIVLLYVNLDFGFGKWVTSSVKPTFELGYWMSNGAVILLGLRSLMLRKNVESLNWSKKVSYTFFTLSIVIALSFLGITYLFFNKRATAPKLVELSVQMRDGATINVQSWEYPAYHAKVTKYYTPDSPAKKTFTLDSIHVIQFDENQKFIREFSKPIGAPDYEVETVLK